MKHRIFILVKMQMLYSRMLCGIHEFCLATIGAMHFSVRSFGCALFYCIKRKGEVIMKRMYAAILLVVILLCSGVSSAAGNYYTIKNDKWGVSRHGFSDGLCAVLDKETQLYGFIDKSGNQVIAPQFKSANNFYDGLCAVLTQDNKYALIDRNGKIIRYAKNATSDASVFYIKHGNYGAIADCKGAYGSADTAITLVDKNYNNILSDDVNLRPLRDAGKDGQRSSFSFFIDNKTNNIYNYKGENITLPIQQRNLYRAPDMRVTDKYITGIRDGKEYSNNKNLFVFDINGNVVNEFQVRASSYEDVYVFENVLVVHNEKIKTVVYNIETGDLIYSEEIGENSTFYIYDKYVVVTRENGRSALYDLSGKVVIDYGRWEEIYPSSVQNRAVVGVKKNYGVIDFDGKILIPLDYSASPSDKVSDNGMYAIFYQGANDYLINLSTLKRLPVTLEFKVGSNYISTGTALVDNNFNYVAPASSIYCNTEEGIDCLNLSSSCQFNVLNDGGGVKVTLDRNRIGFDQAPIIQNGRTLVPLRAIFEALGATVDWDNSTRTVTSTKNGTTITMKIGNNQMTKNGKSIVLDVAPQIIGGRTLVPVRAVAESFGVTVDWNNNTRTVQLFSN